MIVLDLWMCDDGSAIKRYKTTLSIVFVVYGDLLVPINSESKGYMEVGLC